MQSTSQGRGLMAEGLEINERIGGKGMHVIPAKYMYPFHWLMTDPKSGGSKGWGSSRSPPQTHSERKHTLSLAHTEGFLPLEYSSFFQFFMCSVQSCPFRFHCLRLSHGNYQSMPYIVNTNVLVITGNRTRARDCTYQSLISTMLWPCRV